MKSFDQPYKDGIPSLRDSIAGDERQGYIPSGNAGGDAYQDTMFSCPDAEGKQPLGTSRSRQDENASALHSFSQNSRQLLARLTSATRMISQSICSLVSLKSTKDGRIEIIYEVRAVSPQRARTAASGG